MRKRRVTCSRWRLRTFGRATGRRHESGPSEARQLALAFGQTELAASIERDLATIK